MSKPAYFVTKVTDYCYNVVNSTTNAIQSSHMRLSTALIVAKDLNRSLWHSITILNKKLKKG